MVRIEKAVYGGDGLARAADGRVVLTPFALPGELVEIEPGGSRVVEASAARVAPGCRHFGRCGGCQYQHAGYGLQLEMKREILEETLRRAGVSGIPAVEVHSSDPWGYRNRIRLRVERDEDSAIQCGYNLRQSRDFLPIDECPIAAPVLWRTASALLEIAGEDKAAARWLENTAEIELFTTGDQEQLQVIFFLRAERLAGLGELCERLQRAVPELVGAGAAVQTRDGARWGKGGLMYAVDERAYWVSQGGFFQVNRFLLGELVRVVTEGRSGGLAWDLFAGVGLFSRVLAESFNRVVAVEASPGAMRDLASMKVRNIEGKAMTAVAFLREAAIGRERPTLVVMDPPRAGVGREVCELLVRLEVPQIVYVSCDPTTLARDLRVMVDSGYNLAELHLVDLFPQTFHLETVAVLQRSAR